MEEVLPLKTYERSSSIRLCKGQNWQYDKMLGAPAILLGAPSNTHILIGIWTLAFNPLY